MNKPLKTRKGKRYAAFAYWVNRTALNRQTLSWLELSRIQRALATGGVQ